MLQTRFVLLVENFMIRRKSITTILRLMSSVSQCFRAVAARSCVNLQTSQFRSLGTCGETLCLPDGFLVVGLLDLSAIGRFFGVHPHNIWCALFRLNYKLLHHDIVCVAWVTSEAFFRKFKPLGNLMRLVFRCLDTLGNAIGHPMPGLDYPGLGHRIEELIETGLLMIWHLEFSIGRPTCFFA